ILAVWLFRTKIDGLDNNRTCDFVATAFSVARTTSALLMVYEKPGSLAPMPLLLLRTKIDGLDNNRTCDFVATAFSVARTTSALLMVYEKPGSLAPMPLLLLESSSASP